MSQQLTISSAFSVLAMAFLCVVASANALTDRSSTAQAGWAQADRQVNLPG